MKTSDAVESSLPLKDLTLWHWIYFQRWHGYDTSASERANRASFSSVLDAAFRWIDRQDVIVDWDNLPESRQVNARLAGTDWSEVDGLLRSLEARAMLDVFYLQTGCAREGPAVPEKDIQRLRQASLKGIGIEESFLGQAVCLWTEIDQISTEQAREISLKMLGSWVDRPLKQVELVELDFGYIALSPAVSEEALAMLVRDTDEARAKAEKLLHLILPSLFLARLKAKHVVDETERTLLPAAQKLEEQLIRDFDLIEKHPLRLKNLEEAGYSISRHQARLAEMTGKCEDKLITLKVNVENIERLLNDPLLAEQKTALDAWLAAPIRIQREQLETNLNYLRISYTRADRELQGIETMTRVRSARWERAITILFGLFVAFGVAQVFPERPSREILLWRMGVVAGTLFPIFLFAWWLSRKK